MDVQAHNNILDMYFHSARIHTYYIVHSRSLGLAVKTSASRIYADKHRWAYLEIEQIHVLRLNVWIAQFGAVKVPTVSNVTSH